MGFFKKIGKGIKKATKSVGKFVKTNIKSAGKDVKKGVAKVVSKKARDFYRAGGEEGVKRRNDEAAAAAVTEATQLKATQEQGQKDIAAAAATDAEAARIAAANAVGNAAAQGFGAASMAREAGLATPPVPVATLPLVTTPVTTEPITPLTQRRSNSSPIRQLSPRQVVQGKINPKAVDMKAINSLFNSPPKNNKNNINNKKK